MRSLPAYLTCARKREVRRLEQGSERSKMRQKMRDGVIKADRDLLCFRGGLVMGISSNGEK